MKPIPKPEPMTPERARAEVEFLYPESEPEQLRGKDVPEDRKWVIRPYFNVPLHLGSGATQDDAWMNAELHVRPFNKEYRDRTSMKKSRTTP